MKSNFEIAQEINTLAKEHYADSAMALAFAWGCAQALLSATQLDLILTQIKEKGNLTATRSDEPEDENGFEASTFIPKKNYLTIERLALITHCPKGHEYTTANTGIQIKTKVLNGEGYECRYCKTCKAETNLAYRNRKKLEN